MEPMITSTLEQLMAADGLDTGFGNVTEEAWRDFVERTAETLDIGPGTRVFDVGCGAGAFLYPLFENGYAVGGLDQSAARVRHAAGAMPGGQWNQGDAASLDPGEAWDVVLACGVFRDFPDLDYARGVLARMAAKATHAIAILDVPDIDRQAEYEATSEGRDHLFCDRQWMLRALIEIGAHAIQIEDQRIDGYRNGPFRFNVFARL
jgi:2-polyprenyl-3-methyl-5-hydroxy-6-metoxy-1,4-benzoquinol methylase